MRSESGIQALCVEALSVKTIFSLSVKICSSVHCHLTIFLLNFVNAGVLALQQIQPVKHCKSVRAARKTGRCVQTGISDKGERQGNLIVCTGLSRKVISDNKNAEIVREMDKHGVRGFLNLF